MKRPPIKARAKNAFAIVYPGGKIDADSVTDGKQRCKDFLTIADEEIGAQVRPVRIIPR